MLIVDIVMFTIPHRRNALNPWFARGDLLMVACGARPIDCERVQYGLTIDGNMASMGLMKTTLEIQDELLARAKRHAKLTGRTLRAVVEEGLREVLSSSAPRRRYRLPDHSVGEAGGKDPLEAFSWQDLREVIYGEPASR